MIETDTLRDLRNKFNTLKKTAEDLGSAINPEKLQIKLNELQKEQETPNFMSDLKKAKTVLQQSKRLSNKLNDFNTLVSGIDDNLELITMIEDLSEYDEIPEVKQNYKELNKLAEKMRVETYLSGEYDACNAIITIHPGAGGDDSSDWANMVFRMYTRYAERKGFTYKVVEMSTDDESGIKNVIFEVMGDYVYGYFKSERGIHRLIRNSPFNAAGARHTSFLSLEVMPVIEEDDSIEIKPEELKIDTFRSGGAGGQHVNRTDSAVRITHIPTGIVTQCQNERSQIQNREYAMKMLRSKLVERKEIEKFERDSKIRGTLKKIDFGNQIRTYTLSPYTLVKDERLDLKKTNVDDILDGDLDYFVDEFLKRMATPINE